MACAVFLGHGMLKAFGLLYCFGFFFPWDNCAQVAEEKYNYLTWQAAASLNPKWNVSQNKWQCYGEIVPSLWLRLELNFHYEMLMMDTRPLELKREPL